jgi:hypothetical protein
LVAVAQQARQLGEMVMLQYLALFLQQAVAVDNKVLSIPVAKQISLAIAVVQAAVVVVMVTMAVTLRLVEQEILLQLLQAKVTTVEMQMMVTAGTVVVVEVPVLLDRAYLLAL